jgi:hypothetical protein
MGQIETDEIYIGVDQRGAQYVFPVQAKGGSDQLGIVQIEQDFALCNSKFTSLICRPIAHNSLKTIVLHYLPLKRMSMASPYHRKALPSCRSRRNDR